MITIFKSTLSFFTIFFLFGNGLYAQESAPDENFKSRSIITALEPRGSDTLFVNGTGDDFDKLLRREEVPNGRATYKVTIDRFYSQVMAFDVNGFLTNAQALIASELIPQTATLRLRVFDVDQDGKPGFSPEIDFVFVNGKKVEFFALTSGNQEWSINEVNIPIEYLKFPQSLGTATTGPSAENIIQIDIDQNQQRWQVLCDWISIEIESPIRPVLMIHGFGGSAETWTTFKSLFDFQGYPNRVPPSGFMDKYGGVVHNSKNILKEILTTRVMFGVDKVNLVAHSKGGLDTRFYIRSFGRGNVERLIQVATPNNGSEKANKLYYAALATKTTLPAARQLTTWWVRDHFNYYAIPHQVPGSDQIVYTYLKRFNIWETKEPYIFTLAGIKYTQSHWNLISPHDNNVSLKSATLPWNGPGKEPYIYTDIYPNLPETNNGMFLLEHSEMHESSDVYLAVLDLLKRKIPNLSNSRDGNSNQIPSNIITKTTSEDSSQNIYDKTFFVSANTQKNITVNVSSTSELTLLAASQTDGFSFSIVDPQGNIIDFTSPSYSESIDEFGKFAQFQIQAPQPGVWQLITNTNSNDLYVLNNASIISNKKLTVSVDSRSYSLNQPILIQTEFLDNLQTITGAQVSANILFSDGTTDSLELFDDGTHSDATGNDGKYTNSYPGSTISGEMEIKATAIKDNVRRINAEHVSIIPNTAAINGTFNENIIDPDGDELIDTLTITVGINVNVAGSYMLSANLNKSVDTTITSATYISTDSTMLNVGNNNVKLNFIGSDIFDEGFDGPYLLSNVVLTDLQNNLQVDFIKQPFTTQAYSVSQFERPLLSLAGNNFETTAMSNGKISYLIIHFDVDFLSSGTYEYNAELVDSNGTYIKWDNETITISSSQVGVNTLFLYYNGNDINRKRLNGPYTVKNLSINSDRYNFPDANLYVTNLYKTSNYNYSDFTGKLIVANVINTASSTPIRNAQLFLSKISTSPYDNYFAYDSTDSNGQAFFRGTSSGDYVLYAVKNSVSSDTIYFPTFLDSSSVTINMNFQNTPPVFMNLPDSILMSYNEISTLNLWDFVSDNESPDSTLYFDFNSEPDSLNLNFSRATGILTISSVDTTFSGDIILTIRADDTFGGIAEVAILIKLSGITGVHDNQNAIPTSFVLFQNYPNPFNPTSNIKFGIPTASNVAIIIYNVLGQQVMRLVNKKFKAGYHTVSFNSASISGGLSSGVYFYRISATSSKSNFVQSKKMILLK